MLNPPGVPNTIPWWTDQSILVLKNCASTIQFGESLVEPLAKTKILLLEGPLGSGKTTLVKGIAKGLDIREPITSPTFSLANHYLNGQRALFHLDLYRLDQSMAADELFLEEEEISEKYGGLMIIEWPSRLSLKISDSYRIKLDHLSKDRRSIQLISYSEDDKNSCTS